MKKVLFMGLHRPDRSPSQRYRFEQFQPYLEQQGFEFDYFYLIRAQDDQKFYGAGNYLAKVGILLRSVVKLFFKSFSAQQYDFVFVQREAFMLGTVFFEKLFARKTKMVFDFDDSIWLQNVSAGNRALGFLKDATKTQKLIAISDLVFAGNSFLADYAKQFNPNTKLVPTVVDTNNYHRIQSSKSDKICIGWSGSFSTVPYFEYALPALRQIKAKYGDLVYFKVIGDAHYYNKELNIKGIAWSSATEVAELSEIDIGIMPLPNDEWTKGKCALKGLLYMSLGQAAVLSDVGVNGEVVEDGVDGFLVKTTEDWVNKLSLLIENPELRQSMGKKGRQTVIERYSVQSEQENYVRYFNELLR
ncbi:glycosyltransferase family 4 protein [Aureispira anguillae]|uniref:Glycosyltransferase family 4 protein n=1 Tax=Aureispira anguillae TaxID=2864201 RepID=A0A916DRP3_9BACT|nr:glycosyltransferase family 4 protein [Aureispira anguillae]BDS11979.1 glycosyltransferase family 4 protein [Aureispira anguillae]